MYTWYYGRTLIWVRSVESTRRTRRDPETITRVRDIYARVYDNNIILYIIRGRRGAGENVWNDRAIRWKKKKKTTKLNAKYRSRTTMWSTVEHARLMDTRVFSYASGSRDLRTCTVHNNLLYGFRRESIYQREISNEPYENERSFLKNVTNDGFSSHTRGLNVVFFQLSLQF